MVTRPVSLSSCWKSCSSETALAVGLEPLSDLGADGAFREVEHREREDDAQHQDAAQPGQDVLAEGPVVTPLRLLQESGLRVRDGDAAGEPVELLEELFLGDRAGGRVGAAL